MGPTTQLVVARYDEARWHALQAQDAEGGLHLQCPSPIGDGGGAFHLDCRTDGDGGDGSDDGEATPGDSARIAISGGSVDISAAHSSNDAEIFA